MMLESQTCRELAAYFNSLKGSVWLETPQLYSRHASIQAALGALSGFFNNLASMAESTESGLLASMPYTPQQQAGFTCGIESGKLIPFVMQGKTGKATVQAHYAANSASFSWSDPYVSAKATVGAIEADAKCAVSVQLWEKGKLKPNLLMDAKVSASALNASGSVQAGNDWIDLSAKGQAEAGALYATAKAVINEKGIDLNAKAGAACARASCALSLDIMGMKLTCELTGVLGGAEASAVYKATTNAWEVGMTGAVGIGGGMKFGLSWD